MLWWAQAIMYAIVLTVVAWTAHGLWGTVKLLRQASTRDQTIAAGVATAVLAVRFLAALLLLGVTIMTFAKGIR